MANIIKINGKDIKDVKATQDIADLKSQKVDKSAIDNAGITAKSYETVMEETVTTVQDSTHISPYALANTKSNFDKRYMYRVTVNETEYVLPCELWYNIDNYVVKTYEYIGNLELYISDITGVTHEINNVPFVIINDMGQESNSIEVLTSSAGLFLIKIEKIINTQQVIPNSLLYGNNYFPVERLSGGTSTYDGVSIGVNKLSSVRGTIAIGYGNDCLSNYAVSIGLGNESVGNNSVSIGGFCKATGSGSFAIGSYNTASNTSSYAEGEQTTSSGRTSHAEGRKSSASGYAAHAEGYITVANNLCSHSEGYSTSASGQISHAEGFTTVASGDTSHSEGQYTIASHKSQHVFGESNVADPSSAAANARGTYIEIVGNGTNNNNRSNARTLDWSGNESLAGGITLGMGTADEVTLSAAQLKQLLALLN